MDDGKPSGPAYVGRMLCRAGMKRVGVLLTAGPGGGTYQYTQTILDAALTLPHDRYSLIAACIDPLWLDELPEDVERVALSDSRWNRGLNKGWHKSHLPISGWRKRAARLDTNILALMTQHADLWVCPNKHRYAFRAPAPKL